MNERKISEASFSDTGYSYTLSLIAGKCGAMWEVQRIKR